MLACWGAGATPPVCWLDIAVLPPFRPAIRLVQGLEQGLT